MSYIDNEILEKLISTMVEGFARIEKKLDHMNHLKECLDGDRPLDNVDLAELLGVSQRTLARYREKGIIRYYSMDENGKNLCLASEIQEFLKRRGRKKFEPVIADNELYLSRDLSSLVRLFCFMERYFPLYTPSVVGETESAVRPAVILVWG